MATYIVILNFTDQGIRNLKNTSERADGFAKEVESHGAKIKDVYWTVGAHDGVLIVDAPDEVTMAALTLSLASHGSVRTQLLRAFDRDEVGDLLSRIS